MTSLTIFDRIRDIQVLHLQSGDIVLFSFADDPGPDVARAIAEQLSHVLPDGVAALIGTDVTVSVMREETHADR